METGKFKGGWDVRGKYIRTNGFQFGYDLLWGVSSYNNVSVISVSHIRVWVNSTLLWYNLWWEKKDALEGEGWANDGGELASHCNDVQGVARETIAHREDGIIMVYFTAALNEIVRKCKTSKFFDEGEVDIVVVHDARQKFKSFDDVIKGTV